jgi:hypothetical protein
MRWTDDATKQTHIRRRFMLLGQTLDGMRVWDIRRAIQAIRALGVSQHASISVISGRTDAGVLVCAALCEPKIYSLTLYNLAKGHRINTDFLNVRRVLDLPQAVAMAAENSRVVIQQDGDNGWEYPLGIAKKLGWNDKIEIQSVSAKTQTATDASAR